MLIESVIEIKYYGDTQRVPLIQVSIEKLRHSGKHIRTFPEKGTLWHNMIWNRTVYFRRQYASGITRYERTIPHFSVSKPLTDRILLQRKPYREEPVTERNHLPTVESYKLKYSNPRNLSCNLPLLHAAVALVSGQSLRCLPRRRRRFHWWIRSLRHY